MKRAIVVLATLAAIGITSAHATTNQRWDHFRSRLSGNVVVIKGDCILGEDGAAHLKLIDYRDGGGHLVYGCYHHGY